MILSVGRSADGEVDFTKTDDEMLAIASRCFKGHRVAKGSRVELRVEFVQSGTITAVRATPNAVAPPDIAPCMEPLAQKLTLPPMRFPGWLDSIYGADWE